MKTASAPTASDVAELVKTAMARGHTVILPTATTPVSAAAAAAAASSNHTMIFQTALGVTRSQARALAWLLEHRHGTYTELYDIMMPDGRATAKEETVRTTMHDLRKRLDVHGIELVTVHGTGFAITEATRDKLRKILKAHGADVADHGAPAARPRTKSEASP